MPEQRPITTHVPSEIEQMLAETTEVLYGKSTFVNINSDHLRLILEDFEKRPERAKLEDAFPYGGLLLAFLLALLPSDFQSFLGFSGDSWTAVTLAGLIATTFMFLRKIWLWVSHRGVEIKTPGVVIEELLEKLRIEMQPIVERRTREVLRLGDFPSQEEPNEKRSDL